MEQSLLILSVLLLAFGLLVLLTAAVIQYNKYLIKNNKSAVLSRFISQALVLAYKASEQLVDTTQKRMHSFDKIRVSEYVYENMLPDVINIGVFPIQWKKIVTKKMFVKFCSDKLDGLTENFHQVQHSILNEIQDSIPM